MDLNLFDNFITSKNVDQGFESKKRARLDSADVNPNLAVILATQNNLSDRDQFNSNESNLFNLKSLTNIVATSTNSYHSNMHLPAKVYPFELDPFQKEAVGHIERGESVLVAAHTSAGKTAVAEYAIAKSLNNSQRVIYTSPIKALSNQKYRDLQEEFKDVGLMTGDMTINPNATCLIMTTEILRSMLYRGSEIMREVAWVIYDEVHYMRDKERGVVWEESIILLPHKVRFVFLSATIPNAHEFVSWVAKIHHQTCHVVYTDYRPVPLQHFVFPANAEGLYMVVDEKSVFKEENFQRAMSCLQSSQTEEGKSEKKLKKNTKNSNLDLFKIVKLITDKQLDPCIIFSFSKKECEAYALQMARLDFNNEEEKDLVEQVFSNAMDALSDDDKGLPQVVLILPLLKRGVGIHHGGLLPILKEVIEILFQEGLIKCLFATETFSIGINMPAKTVVFTKTRKYDGKDFRWITSGEYIQMSGRAGRRGKDDKGIVIQMLDEKMEPEIAKNMIYGASDSLFSSYHVSYNMVLNMLRVEDANPESIISSSFHQYQQEKKAPMLEIQATEMLSEASRIEIENESEVAEYSAWQDVLQQVRKQIHSIWINPIYCLPFLVPGRMVFIESDGVEWGWAVVLNCRKASISKPINNTPSTHYAEDKLIGLGSYFSRDQAVYNGFILDILLHVQSSGSSQNKDSEIISDVDPTTPLSISPTNFQSIGIVGSLEAAHCMLENLVAISAVRLKIPKDVASEKTRLSISKSIVELYRRFKNSVSNSNETPSVSVKPSLQIFPLLDPETDMSVHDPSFPVLLKREKEMVQLCNTSAVANAANLNELLDRYKAKTKLMEIGKGLQNEARESQSVVMRDELRRMRRVLRRLDFVNDSGVLTLKGRFACELSTADELVLTNLVFEGLFNELSVSQTVALLSCFVHNEASGDDQMKSAQLGSKVRNDMQGPFRKLQSIARNVAKVSIEAKMNIDEEEYVCSFNPGLVDVAFQWSSGAKFVEICKLTEVFEGSIIRVLRRLEELLRQLASAAISIGNAELKTLFEEGAKKIRRGVVFAASLYI